MNEAASKPDGLAVVGVFVTVGKSHSVYQQLTSKFNNIHYKDQNVKIHEHVNVRGLLPENISHYWTYPGSLTTPPLFESVTWIVLQQTIELSSVQIGTFRQLYEGQKGSKRMQRNYRPTMPIYSRTVKSSFQ